jgi:hypothetical protein
MSIEAFDNILLEDTFVLSWHQASASLTFNVLASLLQSHPEASPAASGEWACYRPGSIQFSGVSSVDGLLHQESVSPVTDPDGSVDYGCIDDLALVGQASTVLPASSVWSRWSRARFHLSSVPRPNNSFKPSPHQGGAWLYAVGYIHIQSPPCCGSA